MSWGIDPPLFSLTVIWAGLPPASRVRVPGGKLYSRAVTIAVEPGFRVTLLPPPPLLLPHPATASAATSSIEAVPVLSMAPDNMRRHVEAPARAGLLPRPGRGGRGGLRRGGRRAQEGSRRPPRRGPVQAALQRLPHDRRRRRSGLPAHRQGLRWGAHGRPELQRAQGDP